MRSRAPSAPAACCGRAATGRWEPGWTMTWSAKAALAALGGLLVLMYFLGPVLMPFAVSAGFAYVADPFVDRLQQRMSRTLAVVVVFVALSAIVLPALVLLLPLLLDYDLVR